MNSSDLLEKYKFYKIQNNLLRKNKIQNMNNSPNMENNFPIKANQCEYFPIGSDKSKADGHTIYLVTEESNYNNENEKNDFVQSNIEDHFQIDNKEMSNGKNDYLQQRSIEFQINKSKFNYSLNGQQNFKNKNNSIKSHMNISENKSYVIDSFSSFDVPKKKLNKNEDYNKKNLIINKESKNIVKIKGINQNSKVSMYKKKIKINENKTKNEENSNKNKNNNIKARSDTLDRISELQKCRNISKEENDNLKKEEKISLTEIEDGNNDNIEVKEKNSVLNDNSIHDISIKANLGVLNRSLDEINHNIDSLYKSLDFMQNNIVDDLNNSKIMEKKFLNGMKNPERKNSLKNAMARYNRFKSLGKLEKKKNLNFNSSQNLASKGSQANKESKVEYEKEINGEYIKKLDIEKEKKNENIISNIEEDENENEFSFNSELKKNEKKNNLENISSNNILNNNILSNENINENNNEEKKEKYINEKEKEEEKEKEKNNYIIDKEKEINESQNYKIENEQEKDFDKDIIDNKKEENIFGIDKNIIKDESNKKFNKMELNTLRDSEKDKNQEESTQNKNDNSNNNNIINNSINININNESLNKNKIKDQNKFIIPINNIKYKTNLRPGFFVRKVVREEHYYVDENGKEKILQVKQEYINNEDKKKMKMKYPYKKKYVNIGAFANSNNNTSLNSTLIKEKENEDIRNQYNSNNINTIFKNNDDYYEDKNILKRKNTDIFYSKMHENRPEPILTKTNEIYNNNYNDNYFNENTNNTIDSYYSQNNLYDQYRTLENNYDYKMYYNEPNLTKENRKSFNLKDNQISSPRLNINVKPKITINKTKKDNQILINRSKNLENKTRLIKPKIKNDNFQNYQYSSKVLDNSKLAIKLNSNTLGSIDTLEGGNNYNLINSIDSYIKVNKVDKFKRMKTEQNLRKNKINDYKINKINYKIKNHNNFNSINTTKYINSRKRESSKNHTFHEINLTNINKTKAKLSSNSLSHYYQIEPYDELNSSTNTNKYSVTTMNASEMNNIMKYSNYTFNKNSKKDLTLNNGNLNMKNDNNRERNLSNKSSSSSLFLSYRLTNKLSKNDVGQNELNTSNRENHRYFESKSTKKDKKYNEFYNDYNKKKYNYKDTKKNNYENMYNKDKNEKYFYSYCDFNNNNSNYNNNNYMTEKKYNRTSQYYQ